MKAFMLVYSLIPLGKLATQYPVLLMYQHGSAALDTSSGFQQRDFFLRCDFQIYSILKWRNMLTGYLHQAVFCFFCLPDPEQFFCFRILHQAVPFHF